MKFISIIKIFVYLSYIVSFLSFLFLFYSNFLGVKNYFSQDLGFDTKIFYFVSAILFFLGFITYRRNNLWQKFLFFFVQFLRKHTNKLQKIQKNKTILVLFVLFFFVLFYTCLSLLRYNSFQTHVFDFGLEHQVVHFTSKGEFFYSSIEVDNYLGDHISFLILPLSLIYKIFPSVITIFFVQSLMLSIAAYGIYLISIHVLRRFYISFVISLMYLLFLGNSGLVLFDYHPVALGLPFLVFGTLFFIKKNYNLGILLLIIAALAKEEIGLYLFSISLYHFIIDRLIYKKFNLKLILSAILGIGYSFFALGILIPYFRDGMSSDTLERYSYLGTSITSIIQNTFVDPFQTLKLILNHIYTNSYIYLLILFLPVMYLSFIRIDILMLGAPFFIMNILSTHHGQYSGINQYDSVTSLVIFVSLIYSIKSLKNLKIKFIQILPILLLSFASSLIFHKINLTILFYRDYSKEIQFIDDFKKTVEPEQVKIVTTGPVGSRFGDVKYLYYLEEQFLHRIKDVDYLIVDQIWSNFEKQDLVKNLVEKYNLEIYKKIPLIKIYAKKDKNIDQ